MTQQQYYAAKASGDLHMCTTHTQISAASSTIHPPIWQKFLALITLQ